MRSTDLEMARGLPVFAGLPAELVDKLTHGAFVQILPRGTMLCTQGEKPEFLHGILSGRVALLGEGPDSSETVVEFFDAGDLLIAPAVLLDAPYLMSARVMEESRVLFMSADAVRRAMKTEGEFAWAVAQHLCQHWRRMIRQVKDLKLRSSTERLAAFLVSRAAHGDKTATIKLPDDRKLIAQRLGMTPESLSRAFASLRTVGVGGTGRTVTIANIARLREFCRYDALE